MKVGDKMALYGTDGNKCRVEVLGKNQTFGITKVIESMYSGSALSIPFPDSQTRLIFPKGMGGLVIRPPESFIPEPTYYCEIVMKLSASVNHPSNALSGPFKFLNNNIDISGYNVLHYHITYDGLNYCAYCCGYLGSAPLV